MQFSKNCVLELFDQVIEDWMGLVLPRPTVAMQDFVQQDGCSWCGETVREHTTCPCAERRLKWNRAFRLGAYQEPLSSSIVRGKYSAWVEMLTLLGQQLGNRIRGCVPPHSLLVPVPMPLMRRFFRRIDHTHIIAVHASIASGIPTRKVLIRKNTVPQAAKTASGRGALPSTAMRLRPWPRIKDKNIILIDDVLTTGKTLEVAANKLWQGGVSSVQVAVLAATEMPRKGKKN